MMSLKLLAFSSNGRRVLTSDFMGKYMQYWDVATGRELARCEMDSSTKMWHPTLAADLTRIACQQGGKPVVLHLRWASK